MLVQPQFVILKLIGWTVNRFGGKNNRLPSVHLSNPWKSKDHEKIGFHQRHPKTFFVQSGILITQNVGLSS